MIYKHLKSGNLYKILLRSVKIESTLEICIVYQRIDPDYPQIWVRPSAEFYEKFKLVEDGNL